MGAHISGSRWMEPRRSVKIDALSRRIERDVIGNLSNLNESTVWSVDQIDSARWRPLGRGRIFPATRAGIQTEKYPFR